MGSEKDPILGFQLIDQAKNGHIPVSTQIQWVALLLLKLHPFRLLISSYKSLFLFLLSENRNPS